MVICIGVSKTEPVFQKIMLLWVICALESDCIQPHLEKPELCKRSIFPNGKYNFIYFT